MLSSLGQDIWFSKAIYTIFKPRQRKKKKPFCSFRAWFVVVCAGFLLRYWLDSVMIGKQRKSIVVNDNVHKLFISYWLTLYSINCRLILSIARTLMHSKEFHGSWQLHSIEHVYPNCPMYFEHFFSLSQFTVFACLPSIILSFWTDIRRGWMKTKRETTIYAFIANGSFVHCLKFICLPMSID